MRNTHYTFRKTYERCNDTAIKKKKELKLSVLRSVGWTLKERDIERNAFCCSLERTHVLPCSTKSCSVLTDIHLLVFSPQFTLSLFLLQVPCELQRKDSDGDFSSELSRSGGHHSGHSSRHASIWPQQNLSLLL